MRLDFPMGIYIYPPLKNLIVSFINDNFWRTIKVKMKSSKNPREIDMNSKNFKVKLTYFISEVKALRVRTPAGDCNTSYYILYYYMI